MKNYFSSITYQLRHTSFLVAILFPLILIGGYFLFSPGMSGPFFFDDLVHLPKLRGDNGQIDNLPEVYRLVFSSDRTIGRQLSFLSLLIDDNAWPTQPRGFKRTNILLHLLNGVLVFTLARMLARRMLPPATDLRRADWAALLSLALWLTHPLQLSPTMLVIQRMTLLGGTFTLAALIVYLYGRSLAVTALRAGYFWMIIGFWGFLTLGIFSKEPAILIVCFILVIEATLFNSTNPPRPQYWKTWAWIFLGIPLFALVIHFFSISSVLDQLYIKHDFNMGERLLTETRVLMQYLRVILLPSLTATGPFHDDFTISRNLLDPPTTLAALLAIITLSGSAFLWRRKYPVLAFAILWFFAGHLLESTILPLELYFEHRNYIPMLGFCFAIGYWVTQQTNKRATIAWAGALAFISLTCAVTWASAQIWGDAVRIAVVWSEEHPSSARAQLEAIDFWATIGSTQQIIQHFELTKQLNPKDASILLLQFIIERCRTATAPSIGDNQAKLEQIIPVARFEYGSLEGIEWIEKHRKKQHCQIEDGEYERIIKLYLTNPRFHSNKQARSLLYGYLADLYQSKGDLDATIKTLDQVYEANPTYETALNQAWLLATAGLFDDAAQYLQKARETQPVTRFEWLWRKDKISEITKIIELMQKDFQAKSNNQNKNDHQNN